MLNCMNLIGIVWEVPEVLNSGNNLAVAFSLAVFDRRDCCQEPPHMISDWYRVVAEGELGQLCGERLQCGYLVYVEGKVQSVSVFTEKAGHATVIESRCQVVADSVMILSTSVYA